MSNKIKTDANGGQDLYPVLPLRDIVVFPYMIVPLFVGREKSINALEEVMQADKHILLAAQKNAADDDPNPDAIYEVGTLAKIAQVVQAQDGTVRAIVQGQQRLRLVGFASTKGYISASVEILEDGAHTAELKDRHQVGRLAALGQRGGQHGDACADKGGASVFHYTGSQANQ